MDLLGSGLMVVRFPTVTLRQAKHSQVNNVSWSVVAIQLTLIGISEIATLTKQDNW